MRPFILLIAATLLLITACTPTSDAQTLLSNADHAVIATPVATLPPPPTVPAPIIVTLAPTDMPAFSLASEVTAPPPTDPAETAVVATEPPTATPQPTFTPPALPLTSPDEHYWFRRPVGEGGVVWTDKEYTYGSTRNGTLRTHHGVEFNVPYNTEILAVASGTVLVAGDDSTVPYGETTNFYGNLVIIEHDTALNGQPVFTLYGHLNEVWVSAGQPVDSQQAIGLSGATGIADGPHMHFEVRVGQNAYNSTYNPLLWLYPFPDRGTVAGRVVWPDGTPASGALVRLVRVDAPSRYAAAVTYEGNTVNADAHWQENFAVDDLDAGFYEAIVDTGSKKYKAEVWVYPYRTSYVEIVLEP